MKKGLSLILAIVFVISTLMLNVGAVGNIGEGDMQIPEVQLNTEIVTLLQRNLNTRAVTERDFVFNNNTLEGLSEINAEAYAPDLLDTHAVVLPPIEEGGSDEDEYGRSLILPIDNRVGRLVCEYDTDLDGFLEYGEAMSYGSASLQNYDVAISAAHCVWQPGYANTYCNGWPSKVTFYAGCAGTNSYHDSSEVSIISIDERYTQEIETYIEPDGTIVVRGDLNYDWCVLQLEENLGRTCGWFGMHGCGTPENNLSVEVLGYPTDKPTGTQWRSPGVINNIVNNMFEYTCYTYNGNSGGPVVNGVYVYGITTYRYTDEGQLVSGGIRMHEQLFQIISMMRDESEERWG